MSAMVISNLKSFIEMSQKLDRIGIRTIHFYNTNGNREHDVPMVSLVPFIDFLILGKGVSISQQINNVISEAINRHIPMVTEDCLDELAENV